MILEAPHYTWNTWNHKPTETHFSESMSNQGMLVHTEHTHDFYEVLVMLSGNVGHRIGGENSLLTKGNMIFIRPDDKHCHYDIPNPSFHFINIEIARPLWNRLLSFLRNEEALNAFLEAEVPPVVTLSDEQLELLNLLLRDAKGGYFEDFDVDLQVTSILPQLLLWYLNLSSVPEKNTPKWFEKLCEEIKKPEVFVGGVPLLEQISGKSHGYLCYCFQKYLNTSPTGYINTIRIKHCAYLLQYTSRDILDVMYSAGFESPSYFYRLFQEEYGTTPARYRRRYHQREQS